MTRTGMRLTGALGLVALSAALASSCSVPLRRDADARLTARSAAPTPARHIAQLDFGPRAAFATCLPPACPAVTPKTLANDGPMVMPVSRPIEPAASLKSGESLVASNPRPVSPVAPPVAPRHEGKAEPSTKQVIVHFGFGSAALSLDARASIDDAAVTLSAARRVAISGRTDSVGPPEVNQVLALARANAVRDHLRARHPHLAPTVTLDAKGMCCFAAPNDTPQGRALNRRVEVVFERDAEDL